MERSKGDESMMLDIFENYELIRLSESNRYLVRNALELYRNQITAKLYGDIEDDIDPVYHDIELLEIDEILELLKEEDDE